MMRRVPCTTHFGPKTVPPGPEVQRIDSENLLQIGGMLLSFCQPTKLCLNCDCDASVVSLGVRYIHSYTSIFPIQKKDAEKAPNSGWKTALCCIIHTDSASVSSWLKSKPTANSNFGTTMSFRHTFSHVESRLETLSLLIGLVETRTLWAWLCVAVWSATVTVLQLAVNGNIVVMLSLFLISFTGSVYLLCYRLRQARDNKS